MVLKKRISAALTSSGNVIPILSFARQLEGLYARRSAVQTLIQSLEDYQRSSAKLFDQVKLKTA